MKIAFVRKAYSPFGGAERYLAQLIHRLGQEGHEVHIFANRWEENRKDGREKGKERTAIFHHVPMIPSPSFLEALSFAFFSERLLQGERFDIIHSFERTLYQDIYRAGDGCHREWLIQRKKMDPWPKRFLHPLNPLHRALLFLEKRLFQSPRLKRIIANSRRGKEEIRRHYGVAEEKIEVIYNGVDLEVFQPKNISLYRAPLRRELGIGEDAFVILFLGSGYRRKGLAPLLDAFSRVRENTPRAVLTVAGKDKAARYRKKARKLGVENGVLFLGPTPRARELYGASDLFALPTFYDPFSNACLEAMATGVPVLTTRTNGVGELIQDGENGLLIPGPTDISQMAEKIQTLVSSPEKTVMGERARDTASRLDFDTAVKRMMAIYEEVRK
jgi:UDP-glucose:(heptosyl)LPS alpha-1,3-glucosyltransferase